jgi:hypothetical protein
MQTYRLKGRRNQGISLEGLLVAHIHDSLVVVVVVVVVVMMMMMMMMMISCVKCPYKIR